MTVGCCLDFGTGEVDQISYYYYLPAVSHQSNFYALCRKNIPRHRNTLPFPDEPSETRIATISRAAQMRSRAALRMNALHNPRNHV